MWSIFDRPLRRVRRDTRGVRSRRRGHPGVFLKNRYLLPTDPEVRVFGVADQGRREGSAESQV